MRLVKTCKGIIQEQIERFLTIVVGNYIIVHALKSYHKMPSSVRRAHINQISFFSQELKPPSPRSSPSPPMIYPRLVAVMWTLIQFTWNYNTNELIDSLTDTHIQLAQTYNKLIQVLKLYTRSETSPKREKTMGTLIQDDRD